MADPYETSKNLNSITSAINGVSDLILKKKALDQNKQIADNNLQFQKDNLEYTKALNEMLMEREDTSYQRTVADMRAAGLSALSMQGTNGAGNPLNTEAPQYEYDNSLLGSMMTDLTNIVSVAQGITETQANARYVNAQAQLLEDTHDFDVANARYGSRSAMINHYRNVDDYNWMSSKGYTGSMRDIDKTIQDVRSASHNRKEYEKYNYYGEGSVDDVDPAEAQLQLGIGLGKELFNSLPEFTNIIKKLKKAK